MTRHVTPISGLFSMQVPGLSLGQHQNKEELLAMFEPAGFSPPGVAQAIKHMRKQSFRSDRGRGRGWGERATRGGAKKIGVVIMERDPADPEATLIEAQRARDEVRTWGGGGVGVRWGGEWVGHRPVWLGWVGGMDCWDKGGKVGVTLVGWVGGVGGRGGPTRR